jgi:large subunit ribosomal protein L24e
MVEMKVCSFCGREIEPGTGSMYVKKDGTVMLFCTNKCSKNMIDMKRVPRKITWTRAYAREKDVRMKEAKRAAAKAAAKPEAKPVEAPVEVVPVTAEVEPEVKVEEKPAEKAAKKPAKAKKVKAEPVEEEKKPAKAKKPKAEKPAKEKKE